MTRKRWQDLRDAQPDTPERRAARERARLDLEAEISEYTVRLSQAKALGLDDDQADGFALGEPPSAEFFVELDAALDAEQDKRDES